MPDSPEGKTNRGPSGPVESVSNGSSEVRGGVEQANQPESGAESIKVGPEVIGTDAAGDNIGKGSSGASDDSGDGTDDDSNGKKGSRKQPDYTKDAQVLEIFESLPPSKKGLEPKVIARSLVRQALRKAKSGGGTDSMTINELNRALNDARYFYRKMVLEKKE